MDEWKKILKREQIEKINLREVLWGRKHFDSDSSYRSYQLALNDTNDKKGFLKELANRYKQNNKQPLNSATVNSVLSQFKYTSGSANPRPISGGGALGGNDYAFS